MYTIDNVNKKRGFKKIDLDCSLKMEEGYIYLFTGHDRNTDGLFDILGSFTARYDGEFLYGFEEKKNVLKDPKLTNKVESSTFLQGYNSSMRVKKHLKSKKKLSPYFDEGLVDSILKEFAIDGFARLEDLKEDYCNTVLMAAALATNKKVVLLKSFRMADRKLPLEFIGIMKKCRELIRNTILISAPIVEEVFFDYLMSMQNGRIKFKDSKHSIPTKTNTVHGSREIVTTMSCEGILTRTSDGLEDEIKMLDGINEDERILLENNGCIIEQLPLDELITVIEEGSYEKTVKTEVVD